MGRVGIQEIARLAKVSIGTVDRALHGRKRISERTRKRILRIAHEVGYRPNLAARRVVMMQSEKVAQDLNEAYDAVAGTASPVPELSAAVRKLERRSAQAPATPSTTPTSAPASNS